MTDLEKVSAEVFDLYQRNRYEEALEVARGVAAEFPFQLLDGVSPSRPRQGARSSRRAHERIATRRVVAISDARTRL